MGCEECRDGLTAGDCCEACGRGRCFSCDREIADARRTFGSEEVLCDNCGAECSACRTWFWACDSAEIAGSVYCDDCVSYCYNHQMSFIDECPYCCGDDEEFDSENGGNGTEPIRNYSYKPTPVFFGGRNDDLLNMGMEHEMEFPDAIAESRALATVHRYNALLDNPFYCKSDGSISQGFEMVSHPFTREWFDEYYPTDMIRELKELGASPKSRYGDDTSGIHIHVSKDSFTTYHLYKFLHFHYEYGKLCQMVAGRVSHWAKFDKDAGIGSSLTRKANGDYTRSYTKSMREMASKKKANLDRYVAVNLRNEHTVELRYFRSTAKIERVRAYVQFVDAVWHYTKLASITKKAKSKRVMSVEDFKLYVEENQGQFPDLFQLLEKNEDYRPD